MGQQPGTLPHDAHILSCLISTDTLNRYLAVLLDGRGKAKG